MGGFAVKRLDEMEAAFLGSFKKVRAELGITAFGIQVIDMPPNAQQYPEHNHCEDGQEEVYVVLTGSGEIEIEGERHTIDPETFVRVSAGTTRKLFPGPDGMRVLAVGGTPGRAYQPKDFTELGAPDPMAAAQPT